jgi:prohibitin 2
MNSERKSLKASVVPALVAVIVVVILFLILISDMVYTIQPGDRGVAITLGKADPQFRPPGFGFKFPFITEVVPISVRVQSASFTAACFSSDLQNVNAKITVNYHITEDKAVTIYTQYNQNILEGIVQPRTEEALKEITAQHTAEEIVKQRESIKNVALDGLRIKTKGIVEVDDLVIQNLDLSNELEQAIEAKMVQEQEAAKAHFVQEKAKVEAETAIISAKGQAESISIQGAALAKTPELVSLKIVEKWDGHAPLYVGGNASGANLLLPIKGAEQSGR